MSGEEYDEDYDLKNLKDEVPEAFGTLRNIVYELETPGSYSCGGDLLDFPLPGIHS